MSNAAVKQTPLAERPALDWSKGVRGKQFGKEATFVKDEGFDQRSEDYGLLQANVIDVTTGPTPEQTDNIIAAFDLAQRMKSLAVDEEKDAKQVVLTLIRVFGHPVAGSEHSDSIRGALHSAMMTKVTTTSLDEEKVAAFFRYLEEQNRDDIFWRLFSTRVKHELQAGAERVLDTADMPKWLRAKAKAMFGECIKVSDSAPRLKVEMLAKEPKQPRKRAAKKQAVTA